MKFHVDGSLPPEGSIWVFGSNLAGVHGAGAAKVAMDKFGAEHGIGLGMLGHSYAIPTKDRNIETLPLERIQQYVKSFLGFVSHQDPEIQFFVTRIGCGLAGYSDADIAPMFKGAPPNCSFANEWEEYLK